MDELLEMYTRRIDPVELLLQKTKSPERRIQLTERLLEIYRAIYEIKKRM
ncbi:hypothetical protein GGR97_002723 [Wenyingzhuangia aestuarii]|nr:hypothetical protein [Wenyingzhuangia aestuarii]